MPTRIPAVFSSTATTRIPTVNGTIVVRPMQRGEFWISAPGQRQQRVSYHEISRIVRELVHLCGGPVDYLPGPNPDGLGYESAPQVLADLLEEYPDEPPTKEMAFRLAHPGKCFEPCCLCGNYCTLIHTPVSDGTAAPAYHICKECDLKTCEVQESHYKFDDYGEQEKPESWEEKPYEPDPDSPADNLKQFTDRRAVDRIYVYGRRWYRPRYGGVYCKAYIHVNGQLVHTTPELYGAGDHYLTLALDWLVANGYVALKPGEPLWYLRDHYGIDVQYSVTDVKRERDL